MTRVLRSFVCVRNLSARINRRNFTYFNSVGAQTLFRTRNLCVSRPIELSRLCLCVTRFSTSGDLVDALTFEKACDETLESLTEYFEQIVEEDDSFKSGDVSYSDGVLTVNLGPRHGTYVINRQTPNRQIWLSSPISGPKRYDFVVKDNCWVYKHDGLSLHGLLQQEISKIANFRVNFADCLYGKL
ncbi:frataxin homolog, mitochondrial-like [Zophobas morio]|uniref:frataxin homolog, mitochondrial-like n=1 Tax=Zophobas morio TaxID=2755281 RepID=UPI00308364E4